MIVRDFLICLLQMYLLEDLEKNMLPYRRENFLGKFLVYFVAALIMLGINHLELPLCVINCSDKVKMNSDYALSLDDIHDYEKIYGKIPKGAFVAMRSDWGKRWPSQEKFQNMDEYGEQHYPGWSLEAVKYLIEKRDVTAIGHETFDTDPPFCKEQRYFQAECYVLKQDRYQIEMLTNLDKIPERGAIIFCIFVKQTNGTGFPVRCFAICPNK